MQAGSVSTLLANPVLLLKKLCDIEGATQIKVESITDNGVTYYGRIIANIGNGVYVEVIDRLYKRAITLNNPLLLPSRFSGYSSSIMESITRGITLSQELTQVAKEQTMGKTLGTGWGEGGGEVVVAMSALFTGSVSGASAMVAAKDAGGFPTFALEEGALSFGHTLGPLETLTTSGQMRYASSGFINKFSESGFTEKTIRQASRWKRAGGLSGPLTTSSVPSGVSDLRYDTWPWGPSPTYTYGSQGIGCYANQLESTVWPSLGARPFGIYCTDLLSSRSFPYGHIIGHTTYPINIPVVSYAAIRVGCAVDLDGELVNASPWEAIPLLPKIRSTANGYLAFYTEAGGDFGGGVICGKVDTSRGNKVAGDYAYVLRNYIPSHSGVNNPTVGVSMAISGGEASAGKRMNLYTPNPPVQTDSISGGPVVADGFLYDELEIRGIAKGVLGCNTGMTDGYMGWMDGTRYRMLTSGIMVQW